MEAYKQRMVNEYNELKERTTKLGDMLSKYESGGLDFKPTCPITMLWSQWHTMCTYLCILEQRAFYEDIEL